MYACMPSRSPTSPPRNALWPSRSLPLLPGDKYCVYPSYDFTHCLVDALEHITHSMCTLEFESRRASYYWLLEVLGTYKPLVWEYSRLNITHNVLSKRKLNRLVTDAYVLGWDDPRLLTLSGLRRRGVTPTVRRAGGGGGRAGMRGGQRQWWGRAWVALQSPLFDGPDCVPAHFLSPPHIPPPAPSPAVHQQLLPRDRHHPQRGRGAPAQA